MRISNRQYSEQYTKQRIAMAIGPYILRLIHLLTNGRKFRTLNMIDDYNQKALRRQGGLFAVCRASNNDMGSPEDYAVAIARSLLVRPYKTDTPIRAAGSKTKSEYMKHTTSTETKASGNSP